MWLIPSRWRDLPFWMWELAKENKKELMIVACLIAVLIGILRANN